MDDVIKLVKGPKCDWQERQFPHVSQSQENGIQLTPSLFASATTDSDADVFIMLSEFVQHQEENFTSLRSDGDDECLGSIDDDGHSNRRRQARVQRLAQYGGFLALVISFLANVQEGDTKYSQTVHLIFGGIAQRPGNISLWVVIYLVAWQIVLSDTFRTLAAGIKRYLSTRYDRQQPAATRNLSRSSIHASASNFAKMVRVSSTETIARFSSAVKLLSVASTSRKRSLWIGHTECFLPLTTIASLSLKDISSMFLLLSESSQRGFNSEKSFEAMDDNIKQIIQAIELACFKSKGAASTLYGASAFAVGKGDIDALLFIAVIRIFAEWRYLRLVPDGYKRYAVGMALARRDMLQNIAKVEQAVHTWLDNMAPTDDRMVAPMPSPTLRQLLQFEVAQGVHPRLPRLTDKSGANGLLWIYRQLMYQTSIFANTLEIPNQFPTTKAAVSAAYQDAYGAYHSWPVQQIFQQSSGAAPELQDILSSMNPEKQPQQMKLAMNTPITMASPPSEEKTSSSVMVMTQMIRGKAKEDDEEDFQQQLHHAIVGFTTEVATKWKAFLIHLKCLPEEELPRRASSIGASPLNNPVQTIKTAPLKTAFASVSKLDQADLVALMASERTCEARQQISEFHQVVSPMLQYLKKLIVVDFRMNDPTRI